MTEQQFTIQRIFTLDVSFESPNAPAIFQEKWQPKVKIDLNTRAKAIKDNNFEVVLTLGVCAKLAEKTAFLCEVQQAGIFGIAGFSAEAQEKMLAAYCPTVLFPYARETIDSAVTKGSFPALMLAPVNFDAIYQQNKQAAKNKETAN